MRLFKKKLLLCASMLCPVAAYAANPPLPSTVDPAHVQDSVGSLERHPEQEKQSILPLLKTPKKAFIPTDANAQHFMVREVLIEGDTIYTKAQLEPYYHDLIGHKITLADAQGAAEKITERYRDDGYILSQAIIPEQDVSKGILHIRIVEGFISKVVIQGDARDGRGLLQEYADKISALKPANIHDIERYLLLVGDLPGMTAHSTIRPSPDTFGAAEMVLELTHKTVEGSFSTDNRGSRYIGPWQNSVSVSANSALGLDERTSIRAISASPYKEMHLGDIVHEEQLDSEGTRLIVTGSLADTAPHYTLTPLGITGQTLFLQAKIDHPFIRSREENLTGNFAFDYRNTETDSKGAELNDDRVRALRFGSGYGFTDFTTGTNQIDFQLSQGINVLNASENDPKRARTDGKSAFTKVTLDVSHTQPLSNELSLFGAISSQYSFNRLLSAEQFALGGATYGSAYDPAELSGDDGLAFRTELRYVQIPGLPYLAAVQPYGFYDIGKVWSRDTLDGIQSLASAGVGARVSFTPWLNGSTELAFPLTKQVAVEHNNDPRLFVTLTGSF